MTSDSEGGDGVASGNVVVADAVEMGDGKDVIQVQQRSVPLAVFGKAAAVYEEKRKQEMEKAKAKKAQKAKR